MLRKDLVTRLIASDSGCGFIDLNSLACLFIIICIFYYLFTQNNRKTIKMFIWQYNRKNKKNRPPSINKCRSTYDNLFHRFRQCNCISCYNEGFQQYNARQACMQTQTVNMKGALEHMLSQRQVNLKYAPART